jgi:hypothetical protein
MLHRLLRLNALKTFEGERHESFTRVAEEPSVTPGAVSHQVKALEAELSIKLFKRERRDAPRWIAVGTDCLVQRQSTGVLTVSTSPDFAAKCLVYTVLAGSLRSRRPSPGSRRLTSPRPAPAVPASKQPWPPCAPSHPTLC